MSDEVQTSTESLGEFPTTDNGAYKEVIALPRSSQPVPRETLVDDQKRRAEFLIRVVELANDFDDADHDYAANGMGTDLQDDCQAVRDFARDLSKENSN